MFHIFSFLSILKSFCEHWTQKNRQFCSKKKRNVISHPWIYNVMWEIEYLVLRCSSFKAFVSATCWKKNWLIFFFSTPWIFGVFKHNSPFFRYLPLADDSFSFSFCECVCVCVEKKLCFCSIQTPKKYSVHECFMSCLRSIMDESIFRAMCVIFFLWKPFCIYGAFDSK